MKRFVWILWLIIFLMTSCTSGMKQTSSLPRVLAVESFLADIAQNVVGEHLEVDSLIPVGVDPHAYQPSPQDAAKISNADVLIVNGANLEAFIAPLLQNIVGGPKVISASDGLTPLPDPSGQNPDGDPHFWLDPNNVIKYTQNIRDGLSQADPAGATIYLKNAQKYTDSLQNLDTWIKSQVMQIPQTRRLLITNHETFGYFAKRYGFTLVGAIIPSVTSGAEPSAQDLAALIDQIRVAHAPAIFLEVGTNPQLAEQIASETGAKVVADLYTHSLSPAGGPAATYIDLMKYDVTSIVEALK